MHIAAATGHITCVKLLLAAGGHPSSKDNFGRTPLLEALRGPEAIPLAVPLDQLGSFLLVCLCAPVVGAVAAGGEWNARALLLRALRFPALWAVVVGSCVPAAVWPAELVDALARVGATLSPVALVAAGAQLRLPEASASGPFVVGLTYKLALAPALAWVGMRLLGVDGLPADVAVLEAAMAPMTTGTLLAQAYGLRPSLAAALLGVGVPLSLATVWLWSWGIGG